MPFVLYVKNLNFEHLFCHQEFTVKTPSGGTEILGKRRIVH